MQRKKLGDIVRGNVDDFKQRWNTTEATEGFPPIPPGTYRCLIAGGEMFRSKAKDTPGYQLTFEVSIGPLAGRKVWHAVWLTDAALGIAKSELGKLGIKSPEQLEQPLRAGLVADVKVVQRTEDDGTTYNRVRSFQVITPEIPAADFAPAAAAIVPGREPGDDDDIDDDDDDEPVDSGGFNWKRGGQRAAAPRRQRPTGGERDMTSTPFAFRILGGIDNERRVIDYPSAFRAYCNADPAARPEIPAYLSAFSYSAEFCHHVETTGSVRNYHGPVGVPSVKWDIDREGDLKAAQYDAGRLAAFLMDHHRLDDSDLLIGFSGSKGFHVELPVGWVVEPSTTANLVCRRFAETIANQVGITVDTGVYDRVRPFRAWNSAHPKTGLHKVRIDLNDILNASLEWITCRAIEPIPFEPRAPEPSPSLVAAWKAAALVVRRQVEDKAAQRTGLAGASVNALTRRLIIDPLSVEVGSRHARLFSAAANLAEFGTVKELIHAILTEPGLDTGLPPREVRRQIECGIEHARVQRGEGGGNG